MNTLHLALSGLPKQEIPAQLIPFLQPGHDRMLINKTNLSLHGSAFCRKLASLCRPHTNSGYQRLVCALSRTLY